MIDQRVSEGINIRFFNRLAKTTTIPAQLAKKYGCRIVPVYIERNNKDDFKLTFENPINFSDKDTINSITEDLNKLLEKILCHLKQVK